MRAFTGARQLARLVRSSPLPAARTVPTAVAFFLDRQAPAYRPRSALAACTCRAFASTPRLPSDASISQYEIGDLDVKTYQVVSDRAMDRLTGYLEELLEDSGEQGAGFDVEYSVSSCGKSGVLTLDLGDNGTFVINKQPPNKQIWLSSPLSGPKRYDYDPTHRVWFYHRDGTLLRDLLNKELRVLMSNEGVDIDLGEEDEL